MGLATGFEDDNPSPRSSLDIWPDCPIVLARYVEWWTAEDEAETRIRCIRLRTEEAANVEEAATVEVEVRTDSLEQAVVPFFKGTEPAAGSDPYSLVAAAAAAAALKAAPNIQAAAAAGVAGTAGHGWRLTSGTYTDTPCPMWPDTLHRRRLSPPSARSGPRPGAKNRVSTRGSGREERVLSHDTAPQPGDDDGDDGASSSHDLFGQ